MEETEIQEEEGTFFEACSADEVPEQEALPLEVQGFFVAVTKVGEQILAFQDECTHAKVPLSEGEINEQGVVTCSKHGAEFDLMTGEVLSMPASKDLPVYETKVEDGDVYIKLPF